MRTVERRLTLGYQWSSSSRATAAERRRQVRRGCSGEVMHLTAVYVQVPEGYIAFVEELPGANTQGDTLEEARENLREAVEMVLEVNRELAAEALAGQAVTREPFELTAS